MISPWRAKHRRSEPMLTLSAGRRRFAGSESNAALRERESFREAIRTGDAMKKSVGQSHSIGTAPRLLTIKQVADRLTVSVGCLRAWRIRGEGPPAIRVGSALRWDEREVDAWLNARRESGGLAS
jgi:excisionase family DNA binding protein